MASRFIKAKADKDHSVIYTSKFGKRFRFSGGTWAWRNHNPGNLRTGSVSKKFGQIGTAGGFATFPNYQSGLRALIYLLKHFYKNDSIKKLAKRYAPPSENDTANYTRFLRRKTGINTNKRIRHFSSSEFKKLWEAIITMEGYREGDVSEIKPITKVKRDNTSIYAYYIIGVGWVDKEECIALAQRGLVDAVVCSSSLGNLYLRSRPDKSFEDNFSHMVVREDS